MIEIIKISKIFDGQALFKNFSLKINDGEFVIITGESGCGKTTLLNMIGAIEPPNSGKILVDGVNITKKKNQIDYFRHSVGFLFQNFALMDNKTVLENLKIVKDSCRTDISVDEALRKVGLSEKANQKVYKLSDGEQQRVAVARLMIKQCSVILADEPTGSLDKKNGKIIMDFLKALQNEGKTVVMVTHDLSLTQYGTKLVEL